MISENESESLPISEEQGFEEEESSAFMEGTDEQCVNVNQRKKGQFSNILDFFEDVEDEETDGEIVI